MIDGGPGFDTIYYNLTFQPINVYLNESLVIISNINKIDTLFNIEQVFTSNYSKLYNKW